jgi:hypothetical protein
MGELGNGGMAGHEVTLFSVNNYILPHLRDYLQNTALSGEFCSKFSSKCQRANDVP